MATKGAREEFLKLLFVILLAVLSLLLVNMSKINNWRFIPEAPPVQLSQSVGNVLTPAQVTITSTGFVPAVINIKPGQQVIWINQDKVLHQVAADPHPTHTSLPGFDSAEPSKTKETYAFTFEKSGTFTYHDHLNPLKFKGTVIVK